ncbi:MAG: energy-coupled thiamine transporter ThiT [Christensenellales bacterium]|jgi:thiamine transporter
MLYLASTSQTVTVITTIALTLLLGLILSLSGKKFDTRMLAYAAVSIGLSFALSYIKVFEMPYGGAITVGSLVPLIIFSYVYGFRAGLFAGAVYGLLQFMQGPYFLTPVQFLLDYILAFAAISAAGAVGLIINNRRTALIVSVPCVLIVRLIIHILAGFIFYSSVTMRAGEIPIFGNTSTMSGFTYSFLYNTTYILPDMLIALVIVILLSTNKSFIRLIEITSLNNKDRKPISN